MWFSEDKMTHEREVKEIQHQFLQLQLLALFIYPDVKLNPISCCEALLEMTFKTVVYKFKLKL